jgi:hypothetical protein
LAKSYSTRLRARAVAKKGRSLRCIATAMQERGIAISHQGVKDVLARQPV